MEVYGDNMDNLWPGKFLKLGKMSLFSRLARPKDDKRGKKHLEERLNRKIQLSYLSQTVIFHL